MKIVALIPARLKSTRLKDKLLLKINNKPIIQHTYNNVKKVNIIDEVVIVTDDIKVKNVVDSFLFNSKDSSHIINEDCLNGTERIIVYLKKYNKKKYDKNTIIVNIQGDEPFIHPENIITAIENYKNKINDINNLVCSTIFYKTKCSKEIDNKNRGKLVLDNQNNIMYCSRNIIPTNKKENEINENSTDKNIIPDHYYNIHIGLFVFKYDYIMNNFYKINTPLQLLEDIEWLKIIEQGYKINAIEVKKHIRGIDTLDDYNYLKNYNYI